MPYADRVVETGIVTGTGNISLKGARASAQRFADKFTAGTGDIPALIVTDTQFEISRCTLIDAETLRRDIVVDSSTGSFIAFGEASVVDVACVVPAADYAGFSTGGSGTAEVRQVTVDFGAGSLAKAFDVTVTGAVMGQQVVASPALDTGVAEDEFEMDPWTVAARVSNTNVVRLLVVGSGTLIGERTINLILG